MVGITSCESKILRYIGFNGPSTAYDMSKKKEPSPVLSDKTAYTLLPRLVKKGLLSVVTKETGTRLKKEYSLTVLGLSYALYLIRSEELNPIIESWGYLFPLVLGKWGLFVNSGFSDLARNSLFLTAFEFRKNYLSDVELSEEIEDRLGESWKDTMNLIRSGEELERFQASFYGFLFKLNALLAPKDQEKLVDTCKSDSEIRDYLVDSLTKVKDDLKSGLEYMEKVITRLL